MRIISGIAKGKRILSPSDKKTRPLKDLVKESIFNILRHSDLLNQKFADCLVLDLFSGVGSFGLEAISRGVKKVIFFENYPPAIKLLHKNLENLKFTNKAEINYGNIYEEINLKKIGYKFDLVFLDPPFKDTNLNSLLKVLLNSAIIKRNTLLIIHRDKKTLDHFQDEIRIVREEVYGSSKIIFGFFNFSKY